MVSRAAPMPLNGQQLMMQLDGLTSAMTGMSVQEVMVVTLPLALWESGALKLLQMLMIVADDADDKGLKTRRQWSLQKRTIRLTAKPAGEETQSTSLAWPRMLYLPHRSFLLLCLFKVACLYSISQDLFSVVIDHTQLVLSSYSSWRTLIF